MNELANLNKQYDELHTKYKAVLNRIFQYREIDSTISNFIDTNINYNNDNILKLQVFLDKSIYNRLCGERDSLLYQMQEVNNAIINLKKGTEDSNIIDECGNCNKNTCYGCDKQ